MGGRGRGGTSCCRGRGFYCGVLTSRRPVVDPKKPNVEEDAAITVPDKPMQATEKVRYSFPIGEERSFVVTMSSDHPEADVHLEGLVTLTAINHVDEGSVVQVVTDLRVSQHYERSQSVSDAESGNTGSFSSQNSRHNNWDESLRGRSRAR